MKSARMRVLVAVSAALLASCLSIAFGLCSTDTDKIEPTGMNVGAVQFDAIIELNRYSSRLSRHNYMMLFVRYWVARDYYSASVVWAEPQSTDLNFALHPQSLSIASDRQSFNIAHEFYPKYCNRYEKPIGKREVLRQKFGSYTISNIRFAEQEALETRIYASDLKGVEDANGFGYEEIDISIPFTEDADIREVAQLSVKANSNRIDSMQLFDTQKQLLKSINYEYESKEGSPRLRKLTVVLPQRPMTVGFNTGGMKVTLDGKEYSYKELEVTHHAGGRRCTVEYEPVTLGDKRVSLPVRVTVRAGGASHPQADKDERILRCARLMNFRKIELDTAGAAQAAGQFAAFTDEQRTYRELRSKYWDKRPDCIEKADIEAIGQLRAHIEKEMVVAGDNIGEKLKNLNVLTELDLMLGDVANLDRHYQNYLSTLADHKLFQMVLVGGYGVIESAMFRGRRNEAEKLLSRWAETSLDTNDDESILLFAKRQLAKSRLWTTAVLLEVFSSKRQCPHEARFEAQVLRCSALNELRKIVQIDNIAEKGLIAKVQADWVASIGKEGVGKMLDDLMAQVKCSSAKINEPTESQKALREQLDQIDKEIQQASTF